MAVVLFHYTTGYEAHFGPYPSRPLFYFSNGHFGVELFFCISGFVILGTLERTANWRRFAIARFARIYPAFLVCAIISLTTVRLAHFHFPGLNAPAIAVNATMLTGVTGVEAIDPSYWTLSYEVLFYIAIATVWTLLKGARRLEWPCLAWLACSLIGHWSPWVGAHHRLSVLFNIGYANFFVLGMMLYYIGQGSVSWLTKPTFAIALLMSLFPPEYNNGHMAQPVYVAMIVTFCAAIYLVSASGGRFLDITALVFLGEISYSLYLIHQMVGYAIIRIFFRLGLTTNVAIPLTIFLMIGLAFCLRTVIEKPCGRWIKSMAKGKGKESKALQTTGDPWAPQARVAERSGA